MTNQEITDEEAQFSEWVGLAPGFLMNRDHEEYGTTADGLFINALRFMDNDIIKTEVRKGKVEALREAGKVVTSRERVFGKDTHGSSNAVGIDYHYLVKKFDQMITDLTNE